MKYLIEFEFRDADFRTYWVPVIREGREQDALELAELWKGAFKKRNYDVEIRGPQVIISGINSESLGNYIRQRYSGRITYLTVAEFSVDNPKIEIDIALDEFPILREIIGHIEPKPIVRMNKLSYFPVCVVNEGFYPECKKLPIIELIPTKGSDEIREFR
jgi:hypothetical protein